jgi:hypothetical protein
LYTQRVLTVLATVAAVEALGVDILDRVGAGTMPEHEAVSLVHAIHLQLVHGKALIEAAVLDALDLGQTGQGQGQCLMSRSRLSFRVKVKAKV